MAFCNVLDLAKVTFRQKRLINYKAKCYTFTVYPCDFHNSCMFFSPTENVMLYNNYFFLCVHFLYCHFSRINPLNIVLKKLKKVY